MKQSDDDVYGDLMYWQELADLTGWTVYGWTYRYSVTYDLFGLGTVQMNHTQMEQTLANLKGRKHG